MLCRKELNPQYQFHYFDLKEKMWKKLLKAATLPHRTSLLAAGRHLYAVRGSDFNHATAKDLFEYDTKQNRWLKLPSMIQTHELGTLQVVYLDGFIYAMGDQPFRGNVERYNVVERKWEVAPSLPELYKWTSLLAYEGNILAYGVSRDGLDHRIQKYDPSSNVWQLVLSGNIPDDVSQYPEPTLFVYQDRIFRVLYRVSPGIRHYEPSAYTPIVHELHMKSRHTDGRISVGAKINQDLVGGNKLHAFCIQDQVFVNNRGFIQLTDLKMNQGVADDPVSERKWSEFLLRSKMDNSIVTSFTFDKKKLGSIDPTYTIDV